MDAVEMIKVPRLYDVAGVKCIVSLLEVYLQ